MNVRELIDTAPVTRLQIAVLAVCFILNMLDGIDVSSWASLEIATNLIPIP